MKYLLLICLGLGLWWYLTRHRRVRPPQDAAHRVTGAERILPCAVCGVITPLSEGVAEGEAFYCCEAHRREALARRP